MANRYWVGGTGIWNDATHWSATSGGASGASIPTTSDDVFFDANSFSAAGQVVTITSAAWASCRTMTWTGATNNPTLSLASGSTLQTYGNVTLISGMTMTGTGTWAVETVATGAATVNTSGVTITSSFQINYTGNSSGVVTLASNLLCTNNLTLTLGGIAANGFNVTATYYDLNWNTGTTLNMGSGTWTATGTGTVWGNTGKTTVTVGTSTFVVSDVSSTQKTITSTTQNFNNVTITGDNVVWNGTSSVANLALNNAGLANGLKLGTGTKTITSTFTNNGVGGSLTKLLSATAGTQATISKTSGVVTLSHSSITDIAATGGATFNALNSTNGGNNTGWSFANAKTITLSDDFNDGSFDLTKWTLIGAAGSQQVEASGVLTLNTAANVSQYSGYTSLDLLDLTSSKVFIQLVQAGNQSQASGQTFVKAWSDSSNSVCFYVNAGQLRCQKQVANTYTDVFNAAYSSTTHKWLQIRENAGTTYFETSTDGNTWTLFYSMANPITLTGVHIDVALGNYSVETTTSQAVFDNFNVTNTSVSLSSDSTLTATGSLVISGSASLSSDSTLTATGSIFKIFQINASNQDAIEPWNNASSGNISSTDTGASSTGQIDGTRNFGMIIPITGIEKYSKIKRATLKFPQLANYTGTGSMTNTSLYPLQYVQSVGAPGNNITQGRDEDYYLTNGWGTYIKTGNSWYAPYVISGSSLPATNVWQNAGIDVTKQFQMFVGSDGYKGNSSRHAFMLSFQGNGTVGNYIQPYTYDYLASYGAKLEVEIEPNSGWFIANSYSTTTGPSGSATWSVTGTPSSSFSAVSNFAAGQGSDYIDLTNFNLNIPSGAIITGVEFSVGASLSYASIDTMYMVYSGNTIGRQMEYSNIQPGFTTDGVNTTYIDTDSGTYIIGDNQGLHGYPLTSDILNSSSFGIRLRGQNTHGGGSLTFNTVKARVWYNNTNSYSIKKQSTINSAYTQSNNVFYNPGLGSTLNTIMSHSITPDFTGNINGITYYIRGEYNPPQNNKSSSPEQSSLGQTFKIGLFTNQSNISGWTSPIAEQTFVLDSYRARPFRFTFPDYAVTNGTPIWFGIKALGTTTNSDQYFMYIAIQSTAGNAATDSDSSHSMWDGSAWSTNTAYTANTLNYELLQTAVAGSPTGSAALTADSTLSVTPNVSYLNTLALSSDSILTATGSVAPLGIAGMAGDSSLSATAYIGYFVSMNNSADSSLTAIGAKQFYGDSSLVGDSNVPNVVAQRTAVSSASISSSSDLNVSLISITHVAITKTYIYKVYDKSWNYLGIWDDVISDFGYSQEINSAGSSINVTLARNADTLVQTYDFLADDTGQALLTDDGNTIAAETKTTNSVGAGTTVDLNLNVKIYEFSTSPTQSVEGDLMFTGYVSKYTSRYGNTENTDVSLFSYGADLDNWVLQDAQNNTRVPYLSQDPSAMLKNTLDKFQANGGVIYYDNTTVENTYDYGGGPTTYTFNLNTELEVIKQCLTMAPTDWYFYLDQATNLLHFHPRPSVVSHHFILGKHIQSLDLVKTMEGMTNDVFFTGGTPTYLVSDTFNSVGTVALTTHSPEVGGSWFKHPSYTTYDFTLDGNGGVYKASANGETIVLNNAKLPTTDFDITANVQVLDNTGEIGIVAAANGTSPFLHLFQISAGSLSSYKMLNGAWTQLGATTTINPTAGVYPMRFVRNGKNITCYWNNAAIFQYDDTDMLSIATDNYTGIRASNASTMTSGYHITSFKNTLLDNTNYPTIFKRYVDSTSISNYRRGLSRMQDSRVSLSSSADLIVASEMNRNNTPRYSSTITILNGAYDTRSIKLGQLVDFKNFGNFIDDIPNMQVVRIDYNPDAVTLQLDTLAPTVPKRLEDIKRSLNQTEVADNPDAPS